MNLTEPQYLAVCVAYGCAPAPAVQQPNGLWRAEGVVLCVGDGDADVPVAAWGINAPDANARYLEQVVMIAKHKAPILLAAADAQRQFVAQADAALAALSAP